MPLDFKIDSPVATTPPKDPFDDGHYAVMYMKAPHWGAGPDASKHEEYSELRVITPQNARDMQRIQNAFTVDNPFDPKTHPVPDDCVLALVAFVKDREPPRMLEIVFFNDGESLTYTEDPIALVCPKHAGYLWVQSYYRFSGRPFVRRGNEYAQIFLPEDEEGMKDAKLTIYDTIQTPRRAFDLSKHNLGRRSQGRGPGDFDGPHFCR